MRFLEYLRGGLKNSTFMTGKGHVKNEIMHSTLENLLNALNVDLLVNSSDKFQTKFVLIKFTQLKLKIEIPLPFLRGGVMNTGCLPGHRSHTIVILFHLKSYKSCKSHTFSEKLVNFFPSLNKKNQNFQPQNFQKKIQVVRCGIVDDKICKIVFIFDFFQY